MSNSVRPHRWQPTRLLHPRILQARTLEWDAIFFSNAWKWKVKVKSLSRVRPSATLWTAAFQALLYMGFSRQGYWSRMPLPSPKYVGKISKHILQLIFTFFYAFLTCFISLWLLLFSCHFCESQEGREVPLFNLFHKDSDTLYIEFFTVRNSDIYKVQNPCS